jgi:chloride channel 3/4/5
VRAKQTWRLYPNYHHHKKQTRLTPEVRLDWVQDAAREQARRKARRKRTAGVYRRGQPGWKYRLWESYDAAQGWIVVTIIGAAIGLNAAFLNIVTEWLADIKTGHCTTGFYLNEKFCCWGEDSGIFCIYTNVVVCKNG